jgi:ABC-type multidrug transport system ATPase subunit
MAISCTFDGVITDGEHRIIRDFVQESMPEDLARNYLVLFKEYADVALAGAVEPATICNRINLELNQRQKIVVLMHLLELAHVDGALDKKELDFVDLVSEAFKIDVHEYNLLKAFITDEDALTLGLSNILVISQERLSEKIKHIIRPQISAKLAILSIPSVEMYMLRTYGNVGGGLTLNGLRVREKHTYNFPVGSVIKSDLSNPIYYSDIVGYFFQDQHHAKICFEAKHVYYSFTGGKIGLRDLNLVEESGRLVGIMGSSGSGKSTLLNVLNGNELPIGGRVTVNGIDVHREIENKAIEGVMGYVPQDDLLIEELTVFQNMFYAAKLCFGKYSDNQLKELVHKTLQSLGLLEIAHLKVGNPLQKTISGGQRKRVNIGLELLREPAILFVDEPTSGLSSNDSENIMDLLKELSLKGKLVFVVIHQPSSDIFKMFDRLLILDVGGYQIYYGNPIEAVTYFKSIANMVDSDAAVCNTCGNVNPEQIFNIIETKVLDEYGRYTQERRTSPAQWRKHYEEIFPLERGKTTYPEAPPKTLQVPSRLKQWQIFTKRDVLSKLANTQYMFISLLQAPFLALVLSVIVCFYKEEDAYHFSENPNIPAYIFMSIIVAMFIGLIISAEEIIKDNKIRKRESLLHLSWGSYLFSKITILFTLSAIQTLSYVLIGNWILDIRGMHFTHWLVLFSTACFSNMLGLNISSAFNSAITIYILIPVLLIPQLILGGIVVKFTDINPYMTSGNKVPLISEVMTSRWAFEALMVSQFKDNEYGKLFYQYDKEMAMADYKKIYYLPCLESAVDFCEKNYNNGDGLIQQQAKKHLAILANELEKEARLNSSLRFQHIDILNTNGARLSTEIAKKVREHLVRIQQFYVRAYNRANRAKDDVMRSMVRNNADRDKLVALSKAYQNKAVEELVKNTIETQRIVDYEEHLLQRIYPIYQTPTLHPDSWIPMLDFRTHFYAPTKPLLGYHIDTLWFNMGILWTMTLILYAMLYYRFLGESFRTIAIVFGSKKKKSRN